MRFSVRELAAIDLYGSHGGALRRRLVAGEFVLASILGLGLGGWLLAVGGMTGWILGGVLLGIGANYAALTVHAVELSRPDRLKAQLARLGDLRTAVRYYSVAQIRLLVPGLIAVLALIPTRRAP